MTEHDKVYKNEAERYHALVSFEDYQNNLAHALVQLMSSGETVLETGAGTGRVTELLFPASVDMISLDLSLSMLSYARRVSNTGNTGFRGYACSDHRNLPVAANQFSRVISGWSVCYLATWHKNNWAEVVTSALCEFLRVLRPDGQVILIETLGTGKTSPEPPPHMTGYLEFLEENGFSKQWIRTDYQFPNMSQARNLTEFFFGPEMINKIVDSTKPILPECTGIWMCPSGKLKQNLYVKNRSPHT